MPEKKQQRLIGLGDLVEMLQFAAPRMGQGAQFALPEKVAGVSEQQMAPLAALLGIPGVSDILLPFLASLGEENLLTGARDFKELFEQRVRMAEPEPRSEGIPLSGSRARTSIELAIKDFLAGPQPGRTELLKKLLAET